jgi:hypothetical protein
MKAGFGCELPLRAAGWRLTQIVTLSRMPRPRACLALGLAGLAMLANGCATDKGAVTSAYGRADSTEAQACRFGTVALAEEFTPATFSYQKAKGKRGTVKQAFVDSAELGLSGPVAGVIVTGEALSALGSAEGWDPRVAVALSGAAGGVAAVGAALVGPAVGAQELYLSLKKVSREELAERETVLTNALCHMAEQRAFHDALVEIGTGRIRGGLLSTEPSSGSQASGAAGADAMLEARVDNLRLERAGSSEATYFLRIKTHARLVRVADGAICFEKSAEYRSGKALFLDWTQQGGVESVAETGYRALARYYVGQLVKETGD